VGWKGGIAALVVAGLLAVPATASASLQLASATEQTGTMTFLALHGLNPSAERDLVAVSRSGSEVVITDRAGISSFPANCRQVQSDTVACPFSAYGDIALQTGPGNDRFNSTIPAPTLTLKQILGPNVSVYVNAILGPGDDVFSGGNATDFALGGPGRDRIFGGGGTDLLAGNAGNDRLSAGPGRRDLMVGAKGRDLCIGEPKDLVATCERVRVR
jgi:Ca2+-binding RTX toxin-like protein